MGKSILVIEDDDILRDLLRDWLETVLQHCEIIIAPSHNGAIPPAETPPPAAVLIDIDPLEMQGIITIQQARAAAPAAEIIALTMEDHEALREDVRAAGASACINKLDLTEELLPILKQLIEPIHRAADGKQTVLCIEDELEMLNLLELTLQRGPFHVVGALSGHQGIEMARKLKPDVVLLDLMMPGMDGLEVCRRLKADEELRNVPVIAVTVVQPSSAQARGLEVDDYVVKPFRPDDLVRRVSEAARVVA